MPYHKRDDLPESVRGALPVHAQAVYQAAFNNAWEEYSSPVDRHGDDDRETVAHKVAWSAVKQSYRKGSDGDWHKTS